MLDRLGAGAAAGLLLATFGIFALVVCKSAWLCDDAFVTWRTVDNWVGGYGLTWNSAERVQANTHPLWMFLLAACHSLTGEFYYTTIALSLGLSLASAILLHAGAVSTASAAIGIGVLISSKAFVDYSTSGLENPLLHLFLVLFARSYFTVTPAAGRHRALSVSAGLCAFTRMDALLLLAPALVCSARTVPWRQALVWIVAGFVPLVLWICFSLFYYGSPVPNTAYAKLNTGIAPANLIEQGLAYLYNSLRLDPPTLATAALGVSVAAFAGSGRALGMGAILYLGYLIFIGGDFMSGRLLSPLLLIGAALIVRVDFKRAWLPVAVALGLALVATPTSPLRAGIDYGRQPSNLTVVHGIADERAHYYSATGLFAPGRRPLAEHPMALAGRRAREQGVSPITAGNIGIFGYYAGPRIHVLDGFALADPLLARLPIRSIQWRIGHFVRALPDGYRQTLASGHNQIADTRIRAYYEVMRQIVRGPLFSWYRLRLVWRLNTGHYDELVEPLYRSRNAQVLGFELLAAGTPERALPIFRQAVELDPARAAAWYGLARAQRLLGRDEAALEPLLRAFARQPQMPVFANELVELAAAFDERGEVSTARSLYRAYLQEHPADSQVADRLHALSESGK